MSWHPPKRRDKSVSTYYPRSDIISIDLGLRPQRRSRTIDGLPRLGALRPPSIVLELCTPAVRHEAEVASATLARLGEDQKMEKNHSEIRIYVACLAAYNAGHLHGEWIDANQDAQDIRRAIADMLTRSPIENAEEYATHDYEGFGDLHLSEFADLQDVAEKADLIADHGALAAKLIEHYGDVRSARGAMCDHYAGEFESLADFAQQVTEDTSEIPDNLKFYIDWERMGRDLEINDVLAIEMGFQSVHVFWSH